MEQTEMADALIHQFTEEEAQKFNEDASSQLYHLSIIHLMMGTLHCAHKNFDFGIDYVFKEFAPMHKKLNADTWSYAKKCLFEFLRSMAIRQCTIPELMCDKVLAFLDNVDKNGKKVNSIINLTVTAEEARDT
jgi:tetratricopeptide repeat protein 30